MSAVTDAEFDQVMNLCSENVEIYSAAPARVYTSTDGQWNYTGAWGVAAVLSEGASYFIRVFSLDEQRAVYEQEIYDGFLYAKPLPWFHTFESNDAVHGLSFADDPQAVEFFTNVVVAAEELGGGADDGAPPAAAAVAAPPPVAHHPPPVAAYSAPPPAAREPPAVPAYSPPVAEEEPYEDEPPEAPAPVPVPVAAPVAAPVPVAAAAAAPPSVQGRTLTPIPQNPSPSSSPAQSRAAGGKGGKKEKPKKGGFWSKITGGGKKTKPGSEMVISGPTGFKHESHIGWDMDNGFDIRNIPPEWKKLFQAAGVKKSELADPETRKMIVSTIGSAMGGAAPPPPPGTGGGGGGAPPPPPPPLAPAAPPPPPAPAGPPPPGAPPPPAGPPPPAAGGGGGMASLQAALAAKREALKTVDTAATPDIAAVSTGGGNNLVDTLAMAMAKRRGEIDKNDEGDDDEEWSDEWSDE